MRKRYLSGYEAQWRLAPYVIGFALVAASVAQCMGQAKHLTFAQASDPLFCANLPLSFNIDSYEAKDGTVLKAGMPMIVGRPSTNNSVFTCLLDGFGITGTPLSNTYQGETLVIEKILVQPHPGKLSKKNPRIIWLKLKSQVEGSFLAINTRGVMDYEKALALGEIVNPQAPMSKEQAISKLKEAKDLLDLGMLTQAKFDSLKTALQPIIMKQ